MCSKYLFCNDYLILTEPATVILLIYLKTFLYKINSVFLALLSQFELKPLQGRCYLHSFHAKLRIKIKNMLRFSVKVGEENLMKYTHF